MIIFVYSRKNQKKKLMKLKNGIINKFKYIVTVMNNLVFVINKNGIYNNNYLNIVGWMWMYH